jgi:acetyl/propionyl-CoA carboxylase alpha subunit
MKMKNIIRALRMGEIAQVQAGVWQHAKHNHSLIEYTE